MCAGIVCAGPKLLTNLNIWLDASIRLLGGEAALANIIRLFLKGASFPEELLLPTTIDTTSSSAIRCGAAAQMLSRGMSGEETLQIQSFLTSGVVSDGSSAHQRIFNRHVAQHFAKAWRVHAQNRFQFYFPSVSVPALLTTLQAVESGSGTLKSVLLAAASALQKRLGDFMQRVL
jgi:hypothetical protein